MIVNNNQRASRDSNARGSRESEVTENGGKVRRGSREADKAKEKRAEVRTKKEPTRNTVENQVARLLDVFWQKPRSLAEDSVGLCMKRLVGMVLGSPMRLYNCAYFEPQLRHLAMLLHTTHMMQLAVAQNRLHFRVQDVLLVFRVFCTHSGAECRRS